MNWLYGYAILFGVLVLLLSASRWHNTITPKVKSHHWKNFLMCPRTQFIEKLDHFFFFDIWSEYNCFSSIPNFNHTIQNGFLLAITPFREEHDNLDWMPFFNEQSWKPQDCATSHGFSSRRILHLFVLSWIDGHDCRPALLHPYENTFWEL